MDTDWLKAVLVENNGVQFVATIQSEPVCLIGWNWGDDQHPSHFITDIAFAPSLRGQGLASRILQEVLD